MTSSRNDIFLSRGMILFYAAFLLAFPFASGLSKVNNLFHVSLIFFLAIFFSNKKRRDDLVKKTELKKGIIIITLFLFYFSMSTLWSSDTDTFLSELTHGFYILIFIIIFSIVSSFGKKNTIMSAVLIGTLILLLLTFICVDKKTLFTGRLQEGFSLAPENVIDMAGYYGIGIFCCLILIRETGQKWLYIPVISLLFGMLLTQSRGPLLSLFVACIPLLVFKRIRLSHLLIIMISITAIVLIVAFANADLILRRIEMSYSQSFIRFGIWENALGYIQQKPWFGWGFNKELDFVNSIGQRVHTTHSLYVATLLKGGIVGGLLLLSVIAYGLFMGWQQIKEGHALETSMFLFSLLFYLTQGMFLISNPSVSWIMFWLPLAVVMTLSKRQLFSR